MFENDNQTTTFSDIPGLGDDQGLQNFLNNETLAAQGLPPVQPTTPATQPDGTGNGTGANAAQAGQAGQTAQSAAAAQPAQPAQPAQAADTVTLTRAQLNAILAGRQAQAQQAQQSQSRGSGYSAQDQQFIVNALAKGYTLEQINAFLVKQNGQARIAPVLEQRIAQVENYLRTQEYKNLETTFVNKLTDFGNKWGLNEQDLVYFGNKALENGINIADGNVNLETVFRAVFPEQYAIRLRRMTPTTSSQIYGGNSVPESSRANASKLEDAYVDAFLRGAMPNQFAALNKK